VDDLHPVLQRGRDRVQQVRRADEHHLAQVERDFEVVVAELAVLLRVQRLQEGRMTGRRGKSWPILSISSSMKTGFL
jgi:hypothetical protein